MKKTKIMILILVAMLYAGKGIEEIFLKDFDPSPFNESVLEESSANVPLENDKFFERIYV